MGIAVYWCSQQHEDHIRNAFYIEFSMEQYLEEIIVVFQIA